jgi:hypothetical protein
MKAQIALLVVSLLCGCSTFNRDFKRAAVPAASQNSIEGPWQGRWRSERNGHNGRLLCLMTLDHDSLYEARFRATYFGILHFGYTARFEMQPHAIGWEFNGEANLGKLAGGSYYYEGRATPTNLISSYRSKYDHGTFQLERPK